MPPWYIKIYLNTFITSQAVRDSYSNLIQFTFNFYAVILMNSSSAHTYIKLKRTSLIF